MKKIIFGLLLTVIIAVAIGVYYVLTNLDSLVKQAIETYGSQSTQTAVRVDSVKINLTDGSGGITGLTVANPAGFDMPLAFSLGEIRTGIDLQSLQQEPYVINEITVLAPEVFVEINKDNKTNLNELKKNLSGISGAGSKSAKDAKQTETGSDTDKTNQPRLIIRKVVFAKGKIQAKAAALDNKEYALELPGIDMRNLGGTNGATPDQLAKEILTRLTDQASAEVKKKIIDAELDKLKAQAREKLDAEKAKLEEKANTQLEQEKQKVEDKLKGLFGK